MGDLAAQLGDLKKTADAMGICQESTNEALLEYAEAAKEEAAKQKELIEAVGLGFEMIEDALKEEWEDYTLHASKYFLAVGEAAHHEAEKVEALEELADTLKRVSACFSAFNAALD